MSARWPDIKLEKEALKDFEPNKWVLELRKMIQLKTQSQKLKNQSWKDK